MQRPLLSIFFEIFFSFFKTFSQTKAKPEFLYFDNFSLFIEFLLRLFCSQPVKKNIKDIIKKRNDKNIVKNVPKEKYNYIVEQFNMAEKICFVTDITIEEIETIQNEVETFVNNFFMSLKYKQFF